MTGALHGHRSRKGIFLTTGSISRAAQDYAPFIDNRIILIDGKRLVRPVVDLGVGVLTVGAYDVDVLPRDEWPVGSRNSWPN